MKRLLFSSLCLLLLVGCKPAGVESIVPIAIVDGAQLYRLDVCNGAGGTHYVYYFKAIPAEQQPVSANYRIGKHGMETTISSFAVPAYTNSFK